MKLYQFRSLKDPAWQFTRNILSHRQIYFASHESLNDPFEYSFSWSLEADLDQKCKFWSNSSYRKAKLEGASIKQKGELVQEWEDQLVAPRSHREIGLVDQGVFCGTSDWKNLVLWSHYADSHRGVAFEFETERDPILNTALHVGYTKEPKEWNLYNGYDLRDILSHKFTDWSYEGELRIFNNAGPYVFEQSALTGMFLGFQHGLDVENMKRIGELVQLIRSSFPSVPIYNVRRVQHKYDLELVKVDPAVIFI